MGCKSNLWILVLLWSTTAAAAEGTPPATTTVRVEVIPAGVAQRGTWTRITGRATVASAYLLRFDDGTLADSRVGIDTPELQQQGRIAGAFYECGREAAQFLTRLIGDQPVTFLIDGDLVPGQSSRGVALVGEVPLQQELVRNGWAISNHSAMDQWEIV